MLGGLLPEGMIFPFDFGFVPSTIGGDGDPLDIMVLLDAPAHVGCLIEVRLIGVIRAQQTEDGETEENDRLFGVAVHSYEHEDLQSTADANPSLLKQVEAFFVSYNKQRGKKFKIIEVGGPKTALKLLSKAMDGSISRGPQVAVEVPPEELREQMRDDDKSARKGNMYRKTFPLLGLFLFTFVTTKWCFLQNS